MSTKDSEELEKRLDKVFCWIDDSFYKFPI